MDMPAPASENKSASLETVELELALSAIEDGDFPEALRQAVGPLGGVLLFHVSSGEGDETRTEAAVAFGEGPDCEIVIVSSGESHDIRIEAARESASPLATIAPAYAGLAACWATAA